MAALAYLLLPISGLAAYLTGRSARLRFHGLQAIALGVALPAALYGCTYLTPGATQVCAALGAVAWLGFLVASAFGMDPSIPVAGSFLRRAAEQDPRALGDVREKTEDAST